MSYEFSINEIRKYVACGLIGYYWLGWLDTDGGFVRKYIGRSDKSLLKRLVRQFQDKGMLYTHFEFFPTQSILEAFRKECAGYHYAIEKGNEIHPAHPKRLPYECQYCLSIPIGHDSPAISQEVGV